MISCGDYSETYGLLLLTGGVWVGIVHSSGALGPAPVINYWTLKVKYARF